MKSSTKSQIKTTYSVDQKIKYYHDLLEKNVVLASRAENIFELMFYCKRLSWISRRLESLMTKKGKA